MILESIHMALEKHLLEIAKNEKSEKLEERLIYLVKNSKSASITSVVTSIVLAYPDKCFNVALVLFKTEDFFYHDLMRQLAEKNTRMLYGLAFGVNHRRDAYNKERLKTCDDKHRNEYLETLLFKYQIINHFKSIEEAESFRNKIGVILDGYYKEIEPIETDTEEIKHWRLCLARNDARKMKPVITKNDAQTYIQFVPELDPVLEEYSNEGTKRYTDSIEYLPLNLWSRYAYDRDNKKADYKQYENNPQAAINDLRKVLDLPKIDYYQTYYRSTPIYVSAVLVRDSFDDLSDDDKHLCKEIILEFATLSINQNYLYQIGDGVEQAISSLPYIAKYYPDSLADIKIIFLLSLFECIAIGETMKSYFDFAVKAIHKLYSISPIDAQSIMFAYITLYPKYIETIHKIKKEAYAKDKFASISENDAMKVFLSENEKAINDLIENSIDLDISVINNINDIYYPLILDLFNNHLAYQPIIINESAD